MYGRVTVVWGGAVVIDCWMRGIRNWRMRGSKRSSSVTEGVSGRRVGIVGGSVAGRAVDPSVVVETREMG